MELILQPRSSDREYWRDLWRFRELFAVLAWRDLSVRYKQTVIGVAWAVIRPLLVCLRVPSAVSQSEKVFPIRRACFAR